MAKLVDKYDGDLGKTNPYTPHPSTPLGSPAGLSGYGSPGGCSGKPREPGTSHFPITAGKRPRMSFSITPPSFHRTSPGTICHTVFLTRTQLCLRRKKFFFFSNSERCISCSHAPPRGRVRIPQDAPRRCASVWMRDVRACACTGLRPCRTRARTAVRCMHVMAGAQPVQ